MTLACKVRLLTAGPLLISRLLLTLELRNQLRTYRKPHVANLLVTLTLTFDLIFKVMTQKTNISLIIEFRAQESIVDK